MGTLILILVAILLGAIFTWWGGPIVALVILVHLPKSVGHTILVCLALFMWVGYYIAWGDMTRIKSTSEKIRLLAISGIIPGLMILVALLT